jgi:excisionase family DNA binding protein
MFTPIELDRLAEALAERLAARGVGASTDSLIDVHDAAELLGCSVPTVERLTRSGVIPSIKLGRLRRYRRADLLGSNVKGGGNE